MKFILGTKQEMTQVWRNEIAIPVTKVRMEPGAIVQVKTTDRDGYDAVVVGFGTRRIKNIAKPQQGHTKGVGNFRYLKEFRYRLDIRPNEKGEFESLTRGAAIDLATFVPGDVVKVQGDSKGKGFQGTVKRHRFHGHNTTHGTKDQVRMPGSIGAGEPQHVFPGMRMAGRMGGQSTTVSNLEVIDILPEESALLIKGALPGARNSVIVVTGAGELKIKAAEEVKAETVVEEVKVEEKVEAAKEEAPKVEEVKEEVKTEAPKTEEKVEEKKEEVKVEAPKAEKKPVEKIEDAYVDKFAHLDAAQKAKFSDPAIMAALLKLEDEFKIDLVPTLTKVAVGELAIANVSEQLVSDLKLEAAKAAEIAKAMQEQIFNLIGTDTPETSAK
jgi:large subunit ribosomal protein L3